MDKETQAALNVIAGDVRFGSRVFYYFMAAMNAGYAKTPAKGTIVEMPGSKTIEYRCDKWRVLDTYFITPQSEYSGGGTVIWYGPVPVWMMQYLGYYEKEAIPCLKVALAHQYNQEKFNGGRGPDFFHFENYTYINRVEKNEFRHARGEEMVFDAGGKKLGWHRYQALYMVK
jgi:hypothetical protein